MCFKLSRIASASFIYLTEHFHAKSLEMDFGCFFRCNA